MSAHPFAVALLLLGMTGHARGSEADFVSWARPRIVPLDGSDKAFRSLDAAIETSRVIGMGESVHESEPFLSFRVRFLKDLIRRHQVRALVLESGLAEAMSMDAYVTGTAPSVDYAAALPGGFAHLTGIRELMEWIREWNRTEGKERTVHVYGADVPGRQANILPALDRLLELTGGEGEMKERIDAVRTVAAKIAARWWRPAQEKYEALPAEERAAFKEAVTRLLEQAGRLAGPDAERAEWTRRVALVVTQAEAMHRLGQFSDTVPRDLAMADNTMWILGRLRKGERVVYWAHNAHVQKTHVTGPSLPPGRFPPTGLRLNERLGKGYLAVGTSYGGPSRDGGATVPPGSVDEALGTLAAAPFLLPLGEKAIPAGASSWLSEERPMRFQVQHLLVPLGPAFDAVVWFDAARGAAAVAP